jgi:hypothetical protein
VAYTVSPESRIATVAIAAIARQRFRAKSFSGSLAFLGKLDPWGSGLF